MNNLTHRKATISDLARIIQLLSEDELGQNRESFSPKIHENYVQAFHKIDQDPNQYLMVAEKGQEIVGTCHLTLMPSLTFMGSQRMQIEAVRVDKLYRNQKIGNWMMNQALLYARENNVSIVQLSTNKIRDKAKKFYESLGFISTHEGMKIYFE